MSALRHHVAVVTAILLAAGLFSQAADRLWTGTVSTDWFEPNNWNPPGVPSGTDAALIPFNGGANLSADVFVHQLVLADNASISGPGNLTATNLICTNAWLQTGGSVFIPTGGTFRVEGEKSTSLYRHLYNDGHVIVTASNAYIFVANSFNIYNRGTFEILGDRTISAFQSLFHNTGIILKSGGEGTNSFGMPLMNEGEMRILSGTLRLPQAHTNEGLVYISNTATLEVWNFPSVSPSCSFKGAGTLRFTRWPAAVVVLTTNAIQPRLEIVNSPYDNFVGFPTLRFDSAVSVRECLLDGGGISGSNTVTITNLNWTQGTLGGGGTMVIPSSGQLLISGTGEKWVERWTLVNEGEVEWRDAGRIARHPGVPQSSTRFTVINRGIFEIMGDGSSSGDQFHNEGTLIKSGGIGISYIGGYFTNYGRIEAKRGTLSLGPCTQISGETILNGGDLDLYSGIRVYGGKVEGAGNIFGHPYYGNLMNSAGDVNPGSPVGTLTVAGYSQSGGRLNLDFGGRTPGVDFDTLIVTGRVTLLPPAALHIRYINGFKPARGDRFEILKYPNNSPYDPLSGRFALIEGTDLGDGLMLLPLYSPTNLVLVVTNSLPDPFRVAVMPDRNRTYRIWFHASPATNYIVQASTTLTNWLDLYLSPGPVDFIDYVDWDAPFFQKRFYRVRWGD